MKKPLIIAAVVAFCACIASFLGCSAEKGVSYGFSLGTVEPKGDTVSIGLKGNPTTGYVWSNEISGDSLAEKATDYISDKPREVIDGAGGVFVFTYQGRKAGTAEVLLTYARPWEDKAPFYTLVLTVETDDSGNVIATSVTRDGEELGASPE